MIQNLYNITASSNALTFKFESDGRNGKITKLVIYTNTSDNNEYNLGFGDLQQDGSINDKLRSDNGDAEKVLTTVAYTAHLFTNKHPDAKILFKGSTPSRTRLYQLKISKYLDTLLKDYKLFGTTSADAEWQTFESNVNYHAIMAIRRHNNV